MNSPKVANPDEYAAAFDGWQRQFVEELRSVVRSVPGLDEVIKWGHLVFLANGPVLLVRAEERRVLFGFWRGQRLRQIEPRLKPGGKYEMATLELREGDTIEPKTVRRLVREAVTLNREIGDPTSEAKKKPKSSNRKTGMKTSRVPWSQKLRKEMKPDVVPDPKGPGRMLLPTPMLVAEEITGVPEGALITFTTVRSRLALRFNASRTCPLMTGIFFNIVAGAAEEQLAAGEAPLAPYWRVVRDDGSLSPKTPSGPERQAEHLRKEGHIIHVKQGKVRVVNYIAYPINEAA